MLSKGQTEVSKVNRLNRRQISYFFQKNKKLYESHIFILTYERGGGVLEIDPKLKARIVMGCDYYLFGEGIRISIAVFVRNHFIGSRRRPKQMIRESAVVFKRSVLIFLALG